ncbi:hypothetical protein TNCV_1935851 [Trichonephila clavipes]|nr:hypothetical protein TNCV_1935851 [Trichonephila clavipes]
MLLIDDGSKPKRLPASRALLFPAEDSDTSVSISAVTRAERVYLRLGRPDITQSSSVTVSLNRRTCFMRHDTVKGPFPGFTFF